MVDDSDSGSYYTESDLYPDYGNLYLDLLKRELVQAQASREATQAEESEAAP